ncbi:hypothetical protein D9758_006807 [Tetrapyrgos nigripes]|uniref:Uncharacterized protein n=1 Tax=Tetrapyrgos nigripes TaxID=182062 RepID=A0A8H5CVA1_9AGAR|nr:hypothetical protein D9758_006807 [Tetrapyrgos nigripes]
MAYHNDSVIKGDDNGTSFFQLRERFWQKSGELIDIRENRRIPVDVNAKAASQLTFPDSNPEDAWPLYVRHSYEVLYDYLCNKFKASNTGGVLVTGSPGIGKSFFLLYALIRRLMEGKTTVFHAMNHDTYVFDMQSVWRVKGSLHGGHLPVGEAQETVWCLYDATQSNSLYHTNGFRVHATSPRKMRIRTVQACCPPPPPPQHVWICVANHLTKTNSHTVDHATGSSSSARFRQGGQAGSQPDGDRPHDVDQRAAMALTGDPPLPHQLFIMKASEDHMSYTLDFKTKGIKMLEKYQRVQASDCRVFYRLFINMPEAAVLRDWMFERHTIWQTSMADSSSASLLGHLLPTHDEAKR